MVDEDNHELRYVLKGSKAGQPYLVVRFVLVKQDQDSDAGKHEEDK
jgi:hypothetical protein